MNGREQALAAEGWEARKGNLGIADVQQMAPAQFLQESRARARGAAPGQWAPDAPAPAEQIQARVRATRRALESTTRQLETELRMLTRRQQTVHLVRLPRHAQERIRSGLRANLREEEWEYGDRQGYGR